MLRTLMKLGFICLLIGPSVYTYAPIYERFPGLDELVAKSDAVAIATIIQPHQGFSGYSRCTIQVVRLLKGELSPQILTVVLRDVGFRTPISDERREHFAEGQFLHLSKHVIFLEKANVVGEPSIGYVSVNCEGSHFPLSPDVDLKILDGKSLMDSLAFLLQDYIAFRRAELKHVEERTAIMLTGTESPNQAVQRTRSQPIHAQTNQTPAAAGSGR
jgi:hypothetical protein